MGGDEFLAILPEADERATIDIGERCNMLVRTSLPAVNGERICMTISVGATVLGPTDTLESCFRRVDLALHQSKAEGRDRTTFIAVAEL